MYAVLTYCLRHPVSVKEYLTAREAAGAEVQARVEAAFDDLTPEEGEAFLEAVRS